VDYNQSPKNSEDKNQVNPENLVLNKRQQEFVQEVIKTGSIAESGKKLYGDPKIGELEAKNENVSNAIKLVLDNAGLSDESLVRKLKEQIDQPTRKAFASDVVKSLEMAFQLKGSFPAKKLDVTTKNLNVDIMMDMSMEDLKKTLQGILDE